MWFAYHFEVIFQNFELDYQKPNRKLGTIIWGVNKYQNSHQTDCYTHTKWTAFDGVNDKGHLLFLENQWHRCGHP